MLCWASLTGYLSQNLALSHTEVIPKIVLGDPQRFRYSLTTTSEPSGWSVPRRSARSFMSAKKTGTRIST